jgi:hypothetical protein
MPVVSAREQECIERRRAKIIGRGVVSATPTRRHEGKIIPLRCSRGQVRANDTGAQVPQLGSISED